jgi:phosphoribosylanthranilate isomerase
MMVKICGITNRDDALTAIDAGASALGFNFYFKSPRRVHETLAQAIIEELPPSVYKVGIFVSESPQQIARTVVEVGLDVAQVYGVQTPRGIRVWKAHTVDAEFVANDLPGDCDAYLFDAPASGAFGGSGETFDWHRVRGAPYRFVIAGGLDASNVRTAIDQAQPWGVDACSRLESAPGKKDPDKVRQFVKAALSV